jgi:hypothetical protein
MHPSIHQYQSIQASMHPCLYPPIYPCIHPCLHCNGPFRPVSNVNGLPHQK